MLALAGMVTTASAQQQAEMKMWSDRPADFFEEAVPLTERRGATRTSGYLRFASHSSTRTTALPTPCNDVCKDITRSSTSLSPQCTS